jgi:hypothetical protein
VDAKVTRTAFLAATSHRALRFEFAVRFGGELVEIGGNSEGGRYMCLSAVRNATRPWNPRRARRKIRPKYMSWKICQLLIKLVCMESKIRIRLGEVELDYEGSEAFLKDNLQSLLKIVTDLSGSQQDEETNKGFAAGVHGGDHSGQRIQLSTNSIAAKLPSSTGPELATVAAVHLTLTKGQDTFSRKQLLAEMRTAAGYFKTSYGKNFSQSLRSLLKDGTLTESSTGNFSLAAKVREDMRGRLAE